MTVRSVDVFYTDLSGMGRKELTEATVDEVTWSLNKPGSAKVSFDPLAPQAMLVEINECELQIWINESLTDGHYVVPRTLGGDTQQITFDCEGLLSWFHYCFYVSDGAIGHMAFDQVEVFAEFVNWAQSLPNTDRRIEVGSLPGTGVFRARPVQGDAFENIYDLLQEFCTRENGFDFEVVLFNDGRREITPYFPSKGSYKPKYGLEFDVRGSKYVLGVENWKEDGVSQTTDVYVTGGTLTDDTTEPPTQYKLVAHYEDLSPEGSPKYGRMTSVISMGDVIHGQWLMDRAEGEEKLRGQPITTADLVVSEDLFGEIHTGDTLPVRVNYGRLRMMGDYRIMSMTWRRASQDIKLSLQPVAP